MTSFAPHFPRRPGGSPVFKDITGQRFGVVVVESRAPNTDGNARWRCRCDVCGAMHICVGTQLRASPPKNCPGLGRRAPRGPRRKRG